MIKAIMIYAIQIPTIGLVHFDKLTFPLLNTIVFMMLKQTLSNIYHANINKNRYNPLKNNVNITITFKF